MRKLLSFLLCLLFPLVCNAQVCRGTHGGIIGLVAPSNFCASATDTTNGASGKHCEDYDSDQSCYATYSSNCRATTTSQSGTPDYDYATKLDGTYSALLAGCANSATTMTSKYYSESAGATYYGYFRFKVTQGQSGSSSSTFVAIRGNNDGSAIATLTWVFDGTDYHLKIKAETTGTLSAASGTALAANQEYYLWIKVVPGPTGTADAKVLAMFNDTASKPTTWATCESDGHNNCVKSLDGNTTLTADTWKIYGYYNSASQCVNVVIDDIFIDADEIGDTP
jgi:hypothetical protein